MKKYVQVGCGNRGLLSYTIPMVKEYKDCAKLCGIYDTNPKRAALGAKLTGEVIPVFDDFDKMLKEVKPDTVIVVSRDCDHDTYVMKAMEAGCDVLCEKPLTTTFEKANAIKKAQEKTGKNITVTFNLRFHPFFKRIKELVASGVIGEIYNIHFEWMLDTKHGADYFRRWHRERKNSGSLLVHKSTHHFDIANWLLEQDPIAVNAFGTRRFYGPTRKERSERCLTCPYKNTCEFFFDLNQEPEKDIYLKCEDADGYFRDKCVFSDEIDIEDTMTVNVRYSGGAVMSYSLTAYSPYEGFQMTLNGSKGRMEIRKVLGEKVNIQNDVDSSIKIYNRNGEELRYILPEVDFSQGHGGADSNLHACLYRGVKSDPLRQMADLRAGMMSIGIGMAANISMAENRQVALSEYYQELK